MLYTKMAQSIHQKSHEMRKICYQVVQYCAFNQR